MKKALLLTIAGLLTAVGMTTAQTAKQVGGDISLLTKYETNGTKYYDLEGNAITDMLGYFKTQGLNAMRVRLFVAPGNATASEKDNGVVQDLDYVKALGKRIKDAGFSLMLDFHYSDTWADPAKQWTPKDWLTLTDEQLYTKIYDYTKEALQAMKDAGATPDFIQTGNEISYGMLWGEGIITKNTESETTYQASSTTYKRYDASQTANRTRFTTLLKKAGEACREVCPQAKIILHTERVPSASYLNNFYTDMNDAGVDYDIIGLSYYPYYHGNLAQLETSLNTLETNFAEKEIMIVETGYYYAWQPTISSPGVNLAGTYPISPEGQQAFTKALIGQLKGHTKVVGLYWWMMEASESGLDWSTKRVTRDWYNASLFNDNEKVSGKDGITYNYPAGKAMPALGELKSFLDGDNTGIRGINADSRSLPSDGWYTLDGRRLAGRPTVKGIYINNGRKVVVK